MAAYRASAQKRQQQRRDRMHQRWQIGLTVAQKASKLLKQNFNAKRVVLFGSMLSVDQVHERSDVDLVVWGLDPRDYYQAVGQLQALERAMSVDLIEAESASPRLLKDIEVTGRIL